jgi:UDP-3-O-[3-hydroxymyristoyl] glucosamine N-acyltransferase
MRLNDLAAALGCSLEGDGEVEIRGLRGIREAGEGDLTFVANRRYLEGLRTSRASAVILAPDAPRPSMAVLRTANPYLAFARALALFHPAPAEPPGIHPSAVLEDGVSLAPGVRIGALCFVGSGSQIGEDTMLFPQVHVGRGVRLGRACSIRPRVVLADGSWLGDRVVVQSGAVIGGDGFGYAPDGNRRYHKIPQVGRVVLEDDVEVGANTTIDRATVGETRIRRGSKIDNLVMIAHNVVVGEDTVIVAQVGISGSTTVGSRVTLAGQVGIVGHLRVGDDVTIGAQAGVTKDVPDGAIYLGSPALPHEDAKRALVYLRRLPELVDMVRDLRRRLRDQSRPATGDAGPSGEGRS